MKRERNYIGSEKSIDQLIKTNKRLFMLLIAITLILSVLLAYVYHNSQNNFLVAIDSNIYKAEHREEMYRSVEHIKRHAELFVKNMFAHDEYTYYDNIEAASHLIHDDLAAQIFKDLEDGGVLDTYKQYNSRTQIVIDSVPIRGKNIFVYAKQFAIYMDQMRLNPIALRLKMTYSWPNENNPFGLMITDYQYVEYAMDINKELEKYKH